MLPVEEFNALAAAWNEAEVALKQAEQIDGEAVTSSVNELRYAGRKIIEAKEVYAQDPDRSADLLRDARMDCMRAQHDAIDAAVSFMNREIDLFVRKVGYTRAATSMPDLGPLLRSLSSAQIAIAASRGRRTERALTYDDLRQVELGRLRASFDELRIVKPALLREVAKTRLHGITVLGLTGIGCLAAIVAAVAAVVALF